MTEGFSSILLTTEWRVFLRFKNMILVNSCATFSGENYKYIFALCGKGVEGGHCLFWQRRISNVGSLGEVLQNKIKIQHYTVLCSNSTITLLFDTRKINTYNWNDWLQKITKLLYKSLS